MFGSFVGKLEAEREDPSEERESRNEEDRYAKMPCGVDEPAGECRRDDAGEGEEK